MHEPRPARVGLGEQPGDHPGLEGGHHPVLVGVGRRHQHVHVRVPADHGGQAEHRHSRRGQPGQPPAQHVPHALRNLGRRDQRTLTGQQPGALPQVEGVAAGPLGQRLDDRLFHRAAMHRSVSRATSATAQSSSANSAYAGPRHRASAPSSRRRASPGSAGAAWRASAARDSNRHASTAPAGSRSAYPGGTLTRVRAGARGSRPGSSRRRRLETYACSEAIARGGGSPRQSWSMRRSPEMTWVRPASSRASTAR